MRRAHAAAVTAVEIFMEQNVIFEMRIRREFGMIFQNRALSVVTFEE